MDKRQAKVDDWVTVSGPDDWVTVKEGPPPAPQVGTPEFSNLLRKSAATVVAQDPMLAPPPPPDQIGKAAWAGAKQGVGDVLRAPYYVGKAMLQPPTSPAEQATAAVAGPVGLLAKRAVVDPAVSSLEKAGQAYSEGDKTGAVFHGIGALPLMGPLVEQTYEQAAAGDPYGASARALTNLLAGELISRVVPVKGKVLSPEARAQKLTFATGSADFPIPEHYLKVLDDLDATAMATQWPKNVPELLNVVRQTERGLNSEFSANLQPLAARQTVPVQTAQSIRAMITPDMLKTTQGRKMANMLRSRAVEYESQPWSLRELNSARENASKRLRAFYGKEGSGQSASLRTQADVMADKAIEESLKDLIYSEMEQHYNRPGYFRDLKRRQSVLIDLEDQLEKHGTQILNEAAGTKGAPMLSKVGATMYGHPTSLSPGISFHQLQTVTPILRRNPERAAASAVKSAFQQKKGLPRVTRSVVAGAVPGSRGLERKEGPPPPPR